MIYFTDTERQKERKREKEIVRLCAGVKDLYSSSLSYKFTSEF